MKTVIENKYRWFSLNLGEIWDRRDLLFLLIRKDFMIRYKQTILGPLWFILQPLITTVVFTIIFNKALNISTDGIPPMLFYLCVMAPWTYFSKLLSSVSGSLSSNGHLCKKVYFPRFMIPLSQIFINLMPFLIQFVTFLFFYLYFGWAHGLQLGAKPLGILFLLPLLFLQTMLIALGVGLWMIVLTIRYRDLKHLLGFMTQIWMYATPIIYPLSSVPEKWKIIFMMNPMSSVIEGFRFSFFGAGSFNINFFLFSIVISSLLFFSGLLLFNKAEKNFVDII